ncbi:acyl-CoA dehydrogenase domain protein [Mycobacterium ulcerans str. Harvey]|uniref:Acyl-CoA dehydrogenase domain protein n=1 Tax=Mycobacterium ulcerans str. Harvey TaxID=1299332 RepID=A0ABP3AJ51_MYCUL|nr:acyl-CoA dehydrogenase domain protein [Mycobacterium ulcerans str. Harvey]
MPTLCFRGRVRTGRSRLGGAALAEALQTGAALLASEQLGLRSGALTPRWLTRSSATVRPCHRFLSSDQTRLADLWLEVGSARAAARYGADTCARGDEDAAIARRSPRLLR